MNDETAHPIQPVNPGTFTIPGDDGAAPQLLGGYCCTCQAYYYPRPRYCPSCLGDVDPQPVGRRGRIHSFTVVRTKPPLGLPQPYSVGYVDLEETGLRVFSLLDPERIEDLSLGAWVHLTVRPLGHDGRGEERLRLCFDLDDGVGEESQ